MTPVKLLEPLLSPHRGVRHSPCHISERTTNGFVFQGRQRTYYGSAATAINQNGDLLITVSPMGGTVQSYLYHANTGTVTDLTSLPGGSGMIAAALNNKDQAVGNGFLYNNGTIQALTSLIFSSSGWSSLNATGINDSGQIIGQGLVNGQEHAFLMTPEANETPEPGTLAIWGLISTCIVARLARRRR